MATLIGIVEASFLTSWVLTYTSLRAVLIALCRPPTSQWIDRQYLACGCTRSALGKECFGCLSARSTPLADVQVPAGQWTRRRATCNCCSSLGGTRASARGPPEGGGGTAGL